MKILESERVDVIEPFPLRELPRFWGWMKRFKNLIETDESPKGKEEFVGFMENVLRSGVVRSFAVVDRNGATKSSHPFPLVGIFLYEPITAYNAHMHVASSMKAFGTRLMDEAARIVISELFASEPTLRRLSATIHERNRPAISLAKRVGFLREGRMEDYIVQHGEPKAVIALGLTKRRWQEASLPAEDTTKEEAEDASSVSAQLSLWDSSHHSPPSSPAESEASSEANEAASSEGSLEEPPQAPSDAEAAKADKPELVSKT